MNGGSLQHAQLWTATKSTLLIFLILAATAGAGFFVPVADKLVRPYIIVLCPLLAILSWSTFHLVAPIWHPRHLKFLRVRLVVVPIMWIILVALASVLLWQLMGLEKHQWDELMQQFFKPCNC